MSRSALKKSLMRVADRLKSNAPSPEHLETLCIRIAKDTDFAAYTPEQVAKIVEDIGRQPIRDVDTMVKTAKSMLGGSILERIQAASPSPKDLPRASYTTYSVSSAAAHEKASFAERVSQSWKLLSEEARMEAGMNLLFGGMFAATALNQMTQGIARDEDGHRHLHPTQLGIGIITALLAAGSFYLAVRPVHAGMHR